MLLTLHAFASSWWRVGMPGRPDPHRKRGCMARHGIAQCKHISMLQAGPEQRGEFVCCRPWPGSTAGSVNVACELARQAVTSRQALRKCLAASGIPLDLVLAQHCSNHAAALIHTRQEQQLRQLFEAQARAEQAREAVHPNYERMRHAVRARSGVFKRHMGQQFAAAMHDEDPYSLVAGADVRSAALDTEAQRARMQMLPKLRSVYAVRSAVLLSRHDTQ